MSKGGSVIRVGRDGQPAQSLPAPVGVGPWEERSAILPVAQWARQIPGHRGVEGFSVASVRVAIGGAPTQAINIGGRLVTDEQAGALFRALREIVTGEPVDAPILETGASFEDVSARGDDAGRESVAGEQGEE